MDIYPDHEPQPDPDRVYQSKPLSEGLWAAVDLERQWHEHLASPPPAPTADPAPFRRVRGGP